MKTGISPDSACTEPVEVPDLQSVGQQTCSDYLLSIPKGLYLCVLRALCGELLRNFNSQKISRYSRNDSFVSFRSNTN